MANLQDSDFILRMFQQQQLGDNVDFSIVSGDQRVLVHSLLVRCSTPYLKLLLTPDCMCNSPSGLILSSQYESILPNFVSFLYTGFTDSMTEYEVSNLISLTRELGFVDIRARPIICIICIIGKYRYRYRYIGSDIVNIGIGIIGIGIGICYNYIIGYDIGIGIKSGFNRYNEISVSVSVFYRYIGISIIIGIGIGLISNSRK